MLQKNASTKYIEQEQTCQLAQTTVTWYMVQNGGHITVIYL